MNKYQVDNYNKDLNKIAYEIFTSNFSSNAYSTAVKYLYDKFNFLSKRQIRVDIYKALKSKSHGEPFYHSQTTIKGLN